MPKFTFKDMAGKASKIKRSVSRDSSSEPLVSPSSQRRNNQMYTQEGGRRNTGDSSRERKISSSASIPRSVSTSSDLNDDLPMIKIRAGNVPGSPTGPKNIPAELDIDFESVPFQFYTRVGDNWKSAFCQSVLILVVCLFCPFLIALLFALISKNCPSSANMRMTDKEKKKMTLFYTSLCLVTFLKDMIVLALVLQLYYKTEASLYVVAYSPVVYSWFLILFIFPIALFFFAEVKYEFGFDSDTKKLLKSLAGFFTSPKTKRQQAQKHTEQNKYFEDKYELLSTIQSMLQEFKFVWKATSRPLIISATVLSVMACCIHALVPLFIQLIEYGNRNELLVPYYNTVNSTSNGTMHNSTTHNSTMRNSTVVAASDDAILFVVIGISTFNSLIVSLMASPYFVFVIFWKVAMLNEWKRFNNHESQSSTTLVNGGPQGIAMWWKIRQTLKFFSCSMSCLSAMIGKMASFIAMMFVVCLSLTILLKASSPKSNFDSHNVVFLLFDNILLYLALLVIGTLTILVENEKRLSSDMIQLKLLNITYELGNLMNLDQEAIESEPGVRVKVRVMRGCSMLLKELTSAMENLERGTSSRLVLVCFGVSTLMILPSTAIALKFLTSHAI